MYIVTMPEKTAGKRPRERKLKGTTVRRAGIGFTDGVANVRDDQATHAAIAGFHRLGFTIEKEGSNGKRTELTGKKLTSELKRLHDRENGRASKAPAKEAEKPKPKEPTGDPNPAVGDGDPGTDSDKPPGKGAEDKKK